jgi:hypothetical protein
MSCLQQDILSFLIVTISPKEANRMVETLNALSAAIDHIDVTCHKRELLAPKFYANGLKNFFQNAHITPWISGDTPRHRTAAAVHLICPSLEFLDRGKTRLRVPGAISEAMTKVLWSVTKTLYEEEEQRRKDGAKTERHARERQRAEQSKRWSMQDAVFQVKTEGWNHASGNGAYSGIGKERGQIPESSVLTGGARR